MKILMGERLVKFSRKDDDCVTMDVVSTTTYQREEHESVEEFQASFPTEGKTEANALMSLENGKYTVLPFSKCSKPS